MWLENLTGREIRLQEKQGASFESIGKSEEAPNAKPSTNYSLSDDVKYRRRRLIPAEDVCIGNEGMWWFQFIGLCSESGV
ncbi:Hypothetical predicted protein [Olea europaea subsp. europaea]|uniref:Uncharacterized protein n=1 Tax=Olea europaea subsp. europaea TaxID=158383 RepID=A0A8S0RVL3_OLEEU|nr:Hypothetical predicted protein [Olea europaea subsp. europaea]